MWRGRGEFIVEDMGGSLCTVEKGLSVSKENEENERKKKEMVRTWKESKSRRMVTIDMAVLLLR